MKFIGEFKCPKCGWIHVGISEADAIAHVDSFNRFFATLDTDERRNTFGNRLASLETYQRCFRCGSPSADFVPATNTDCPPGVTLQAVIAPVFQKTAP